MAIVENTLKNIPLFFHLSEAAIARLGEALLPEQLDTGKVLFHQGEHGTDMFIVVEGAVKVVLADEHGRELVLNECGPGEVIGELALLSQEPRAATVIATRPTRLLKLTRDVFLRFLESVAHVGSDSVQDSHRYLRQQYKIQLLKHIDWFSTLPLTDLAVIADQLHAKSFARNDILFQRGDPGDAFYIIIQGWVNAFVNSDEGSMIVLNQFGPGDIFGEMALLDNKPRSAGIMALTPLEVLALNRNDFLDVLQEHSAIALETLRGLSGKLRFAATYVEKAVAWSQRIADGDYSMVLDEIEASQHEVVGAMASDDFSVRALLSALYKMTQGVQQREDELRQEISALKLKIEINEEKRQEQVQAITQSPFFASLRAQVQKLREESQAGTE